VNGAGSKISQVENKALSSHRPQAGDSRTKPDAAGAFRTVVGYFLVYDTPVLSNQFCFTMSPRRTACDFCDGTQTRDYTYADNIVTANRRLVEAASVDGEVLYIGSTGRITITELAQVIRDEIDPSLELIYDDPREGDAEHTHADVSKAADLLDHEPSVTIQDGARQFVEWYRQNQEWYDPLVRRS